MRLQDEQFNKTTKVGDFEGTLGNDASLTFRDETPETVAGAFQTGESDGADIGNTSMGGWPPPDGNTGIGGPWLQGWENSGNSNQTKIMTLAEYDKKYPMAKWAIFVILLGVVVYQFRHKLA